MIPKVTTEPRFRAHFEQFGPIARVELTAHRSFGFVTYADEASVARVLETRMHTFSHMPNNTAYIEVRKPNPRQRVRPDWRADRR